MFLNDRKIKILEAIIKDYIQTAEPIGSRTIAKKYDLGISSATIRNEMSDLEELGLIVQPHASSGRVPSDKGYRLYVDRLKNYRALTEEETGYLEKVIRTNLNQMDFLMKETAKAISLLTNYTTIVSEPQLKKTVIKYIQLVPLDEKSIVLVLVTESKVVKNHVIHLGRQLSYENLMRLSMILNNNLQGLSVTEINWATVTKVKEEWPEYGDCIENILKSVFNSVQAEDDVQVYTSGVKNILGFPEFSDVDKARALFQTLEEKNMLINILGAAQSDGIQIVIGGENAMEQMKGCSLIKANYMLGDKAYGCIGVIGPTRMEYLEVISILNGIVKNINNLIQSLSDG